MNTYNKYKNHLKKVKDIEATMAVLHWDQEIYMPSKGEEQRGNQLATLAGISHDLLTDENYIQLIENLSADDSLSDIEKRNVQESFKDVERKTKYTKAFVEQQSLLVSKALGAWQKAKQQNNFKVFQPLLNEIIESKREECELLGYDEHPYDALLGLYEPQLKTSFLVNLFSDVRNKLVPFVEKIRLATQNDESVMYKSYDEDKQWQLSLYLLKKMGYDFDKGRQDISSHPFTTSFGSSDVRVTTRINKNDLAEVIWSSIHEGGHALYEQGLLDANYGLPSGDATSLAIHESQSRLWENNVGRSLPYWQANYKKVQELFPEQTNNVSCEDFYKAMNIVKPSFIRTSADELTYHFHVLIRFEVEKAIFDKSIHVQDIPEYWNHKYKTYLGIDVPSDSQGVLQDIHWAHGSFGYFPTYSLGSFYAAQFFKVAQKQIPDLTKKISEGNHVDLLNWLRKNIHIHGRLLSAEEICIQLTGEKLNFNYFMDYAKEKYKNLYNIEV